MKEKGKSSKRNKTLKLSIVMVGLSVLLLAMTFTFLAATPVAGQVEVKVNAPEEVEEGESFDVTIDIEDVTDFNSGQFDLSFDSEVLEVTDVSDGSIDGETIPIYKSDFVDNNTVAVSMPMEVGVSGSGHLARIGFKVVGTEGDKSILDISNGALYDIRAMEFTIDEKFKDELNEGVISDDLKAIFESKERPLENPTVKVIKKDEKWKIIDKRVYVVMVDVHLTIMDTKEILETEWVDAEITVGEEEEEAGEEVTPGYSNITTWNPVDAVVNNAVEESRTFNLTVNQIADICWQINGTEVQTNESTREAVFTKSAVIGAWNVSVIATNTTTGLSDLHTWIWSVTHTAILTPPPTITPGEISKPTPTRAPGETSKPTPTRVPGETPKPTTAPTPKPPGFGAIFAIAVI